MKVHRVIRQSAARHPARNARIDLQNAHPCALRRDSVN
jgi:hypothetical protein